MRVCGNIVDVVNKRIYGGMVEVSEGVIKSITRDDRAYDSYILPGLIDSHVHIESSMMVPSEFARVAVLHGMVGAVCDPHEIANVLGLQGVRYMIEDGQKVPFRFYFGAPSCVPATGIETSGASLGPKETEELLADRRILFLAEMMNFPGVIYSVPEVIEKIALAKRYGKRIDGHAPMLCGDALKTYADAGITTDHECSDISEAKEKIGLGMKIMIREGTAAKNFDDLIGLMARYPDDCMFCTDDCHPEELANGTIDSLIRRALKKGYDAISLVRAASFNPVTHYGLDAGLLRVDDPADFIIVDNLDDFNVLKTYIRGELVARSGVSLIEPSAREVVNRFDAAPVKAEDFKIYAKDKYVFDEVKQKPSNPDRNMSDQIPPEKINVIGATKGSLLTDRLKMVPCIRDGEMISDLSRDVIKVAGINRYGQSGVRPALGFVKGFGIKEGAIASSVAHDSHNIVAIGSDDDYIARAVNLVIEKKGGLAVAFRGGDSVMALPIAGLMSDLSYPLVQSEYDKINKAALSTGLELSFMDLSFMALPVIPHLKMTDKGLFDVDGFRLIGLTDKN